MSRCDGMLRQGVQCRFKARAGSDRCMVHQWGSSWKVHQWSLHLSAADKEAMRSAVGRLSPTDLPWQHISPHWQQRSESVRIIKRLTEDCFPQLLPAVWSFGQLERVWYDVWYEAPRYADDETDDETDDEKEPIDWADPNCSICADGEEKAP